MRPITILSLPNCGSDWFARAMAKVTGRKYYDKEFFNPICNRSLCSKLGIEGFGCELVRYWRNIGNTTPTGTACLDEFHRAGYQLNKEVYSFCKLDWYLEFSDVIILLRREDTLFPPSRLRVLQWYDAIYWSLILNSFLAQPTDHDAYEHVYEQGIESVARRGFRGAFEILDRASARGLPTLSYETLVTTPRDAVRPLDELLGASTELLADELARSVSPTKNPTLF